MAELKTILAVASAAFSAVSSISQGVAQRRAADARASSLERQGTRDRLIALREAQEKRREGARQAATARARAAAGGRTFEGSTLAILGDIAAENEFSALNIEAGGAEANRRAREEAGLTRAEGRDSQTAGFLKAGGTLLTAGSRLPKGTFGLNKKPGGSDVA